MNFPFEGVSKIKREKCFFFLHKEKGWHFAKRKIVPPCQLDQGHSNKNTNRTNTTFGFYLLVCYIFAAIIKLCNINTVPPKNKLINHLQSLFLSLLFIRKRLSCISDTSPERIESGNFGLSHFFTSRPYNDLHRPDCLLLQFNFRPLLSYFFALENCFAGENLISCLLFFS